MEIFIIAAGLVALDLLALRFGTDSRLTIDREPRSSGILE